MPIRATFADVQASRIPNVLNQGVNDTRLYAYVNEAIQRLMNKGKWVGTVQKYQICTSNGAITWPRQIETIESVDVCDNPISIRNGWFEFVENSWGLIEEDEGAVTHLVDQGTACSYLDITPDGKKLKLYCSHADDASVTYKTLLQGYDDDGNWIRTKVGTTWYDGEWVTPSVAGTLTTKYFASLTGVQKPASNSAFLLYEHDVAAASQRQIGYYEYDETKPCYRRSLIPGLSQCGGCDDTSDTSTVTVLAKMAFLPVSRAEDWLLIGNIPAIKLMCQAIRKEENNLWDEAKRYEASALEELQKELNVHNGDSVVVALRLPPSAIYGGNVGRLD